MSKIVKFIHTADWQVGKPFAGIEDANKRVLAQHERVNMISRIGDAARAHGAEFIVVAGDLFDSSSVTKATVSATCSAIGRLGIPVLAIPGNHDHGGPDGIWDKPFFQRERESLAPNFRILLTPEPVELESAVLFPCPLLRRSDTADSTAWLRAFDPFAASCGDRARIVLAHGSTQGFGSQTDDEDALAMASNQIELGRLDAAALDYIALGDWHGTKQVAAKAWYAGTPELDRFPKGEANDPGHVLAVIAGRGSDPVVTPIETARFRWHQYAFDFSDDAALGRLQEAMEGLVANRAQEDFLRLELTGSLGIQATTQLEHFLDALHSRLLRVKLSNRTSVAPTPDEIQALTQRTGDPLISQVASKLVALASGIDEQAAVARVALRELHAASTQHQTLHHAH